MNNNNNNFYHIFNTPLSNPSDGPESGSIGPSVYPSNGVSQAMNSNNYTINRSQQPSSASTISFDFDPANANSNNISPQQAQQRRRIIQHLALLLHAHKCLQREQQALTNGNTDFNGNHQPNLPSPCTLPNCGTMRTVLQHMTKCSDFKNCSFNYCVQSRHIILHWKHCTSPTCVLCGTLKRPAAPRLNTPGNREWQKRLDPTRRSALVNKIATSLFETLKQDMRILNQEFSTTVQNYAKKTESEIFNTATSYEDYFQRLAERIFKMCKDAEENQNGIRHTSILGSAVSIDKSAGEQGPPNRIAPSSDDLPENIIKTESIEIKISTSSSSADAQRLSNVIHNRMSTETKSTPTNGQTHSETNGIHREINPVKIELESSNAQSMNASTTIIHSTSIKREILSPNESSKNQTNDGETKLTTQSEPIDATSKSLLKHPAQFSVDDIRQKMYPILERLYHHDDGGWFRQPVTEAIAPGYFNVIKSPMDFSTIMKKFEENQYTTPYQFCEDVWLVFKNTWLFNKKTHRVYKAGVKLADIFMDAVDPIMKDYGYCCGRYYVFLPSAMFCYGANGICCTIARDGDYFYYQNPDASRPNLSGDKYTFCKKCFDSVKAECILVGDDPAQTLVEVPKSSFLPAKNDQQELESIVDCIVCSRKFHNICVLYHEHIWPEGYVCQTCVKQHNIKRRENRYLAHKLTNTELANILEQRVNDFLQRECHPETGRVTIRVLAASDRICDVKPRLKRYFGSQIPDGYPYRTKAIFAFQEIQGVDVVLFGMHVQEYDGRCPAPNTRRVYVSYLDSVHYFRPKEKRTAVYYEILIGYLDYVKKLGFIYAHIWACPPSEGDDYIFYCHPPEQRVPKPKRLQEWYKSMLEVAVAEGVVLDYKDILKDCVDNGIAKATDIPYFEGDFWSSTIEDLIKELDTEEEDRRKFEELEAVKTSDDVSFDDTIEPEEPTEMSDKRKSGSGPNYKKKNFKKTTGQRRAARKNMTNGNDLISKIMAMMEKHKDSFFVVRLRNPMSNYGSSVDTDPMIQCDLMESRDAFLNFAREKHCEFSSLRRAKYSTMTALIDLHSSTADKLSYTCNECRNPCDIRYHCTVCEDFDLCSKCFATGKHPHRMEKSDDSQESSNNNHLAVNVQQQRQLAMQRMLDTIRHAVQCRNANCLMRHCNQCKMILKHSTECTKPNRQQCNVCNKLYTPIWHHAKTCFDQNCPLPYCAMFKQKLLRQRAATIQLDRRRMHTMHQANTTSNSSPMNVQNTEANPPTQYQYSMESPSPSSSGKMMPASGKSGKPAVMATPITRPSLQQNVSIQSNMTNAAHYYNGGKGNPQTNTNMYAMQTVQHTAVVAAAAPPPQLPPPPPPPPINQQWFPQSVPSQANRYPTHGGKPLSYSAQRMPYSSDSYQNRPTMSPSPYSFQNQSMPPGYSQHQQITETNVNISSRMGSPMTPSSSISPRFPQPSYYSHQSPIPYQPLSPAPTQHRTQSQTNLSPAYSLSNAPVASNGPGSKSSSIDSIDMKTDETYDDPLKQQMFHPLLQSRLRPSTPNFYPNMQQPVPNQYYHTQRPMTPTNEYGMPVVRGPVMRSTSIPPNAYGTLANQPRMRTSLNTVTSDPSVVLNPNMLGHTSTSSPVPPGTPR